MKRIIFLSCLIFFSSCSIASDKAQKWSLRFTDSEQVQLLYTKAMDKFKKAKFHNNPRIMKDAESDFQFLANDFNDKKSEKLLSEIKNYYTEYEKYYCDLLKESLQKNYVFTSAGYYKRLLLLDSTDSEANEFLETHHEDIEKRLTINLASAKKFYDEKKYQDARTRFSRILIFDPNNEEAKKAINKINDLFASQNRKKIKVKKYDNASQNDSKEEIEIDPNEKNKLYDEALKAYENKDFIKALEFFENINDSTYKDTMLYYNRTIDKINTLGLGDNKDDN
jgi:tetratricopeptide (TPR) repeat protein